MTTVVSLEAIQLWIRSVLPVESSTVLKTENLLDGSLAKDLVLHLATEQLGCHGLAGRLLSRASKEDNRVLQNWLSVLRYLDFKITPDLQNQAENPCSEFVLSLLQLIFWRCHVPSVSQQALRSCTLVTAQTASDIEFLCLDALLSWASSVVDPLVVSKLSQLMERPILLVTLLARLLNCDCPTDGKLITATLVQALLVLGSQVLHVRAMFTGEDLLRNGVDSGSLLCFLALLHSAVHTRLEDYEDSNLMSALTKHASGCPHCGPRHRVLVYGAGLRVGQVGQRSAFFLRIHSKKVALSDINIHIECRSAQAARSSYCPDLFVDQVDDITHMIYYTPTHPGSFLVEVKVADANCHGSPFRFIVHKGGAMLFSAYNTDKVAKDLRSNFLPNSYCFSTSESIARLDKDLLLHVLYHHNPGVSEVGKLNKLSLFTRSEETGPLSVTVTCPALSVPAPSVKSQPLKSDTHHEIAYIPTEPGVYEVNVRWGDASVYGSPFYSNVLSSHDR